MSTPGPAERSDHDGLRQRVAELEDQLRAAAAVDHERARELKTLEEQAHLLDLAHDTIMVRRLDGVILYWNKGAERMYGLTREEAVGRTSHEILATEFPVPLTQIERALIESGHWEGELRHSGPRGQVTVDSRWALRRDARGEPEAVLEINNDMTARKEAEAERNAGRKTSFALRRSSSPSSPRRSFPSPMRWW
ncbi:PAS domain-containing protein [Chondromyces apiculatus]|uniref:Putative PAS/PAC sensor protein n=1 Tax=Chondromyces apiculatus DSM 436 TaxID=1192034 RepID=A0A017SYE2_9BACT|nr:PAS domain S-box protein [Chondromyces apiculatus]EYF01973.1 putative PAS/PAC sensor protein [Chondromyces apiculatus DSM 436]